jgi:hypothetical protein
MRCRLVVLRLCPEYSRVAFDMVALAENTDAECDDAGIVGLRSAQALEIAGRRTARSPLLSGMCNLHNRDIYFPHPCF